MNSTLLIAAGPLDKVQSAIDELGDIGVALEHAKLVSTKGYRVPSIEQYQDLSADSYSEQQRLDYNKGARVIVIQYSPTLISYVNVYRFLRASGVGDFAIKVAGQPLIETSVQTVFDSFGSGQNVQSQDNAVRYIDPCEITLRHEFSPAEYGKVIDGDWDLQVTEFEQSVLFYRSLIERVENNAQWSETEYYQDVVNSLNNGEPRFGCRNLEQFERHCEKLDAIYLDMKTSGWRQTDDSDYVSINISRDGKVIFNDGRHRLSMAKQLKLESIPVKVAVRHQQWQEFKNEIKAFADKFYGGKVYAKIQHVDLQDIAFSQEDKRLEIISEHLNADSKTLLDIGSHWGYFCCGFERKGLDCTAVEADVSNFYFLDKIRRAQNLKFTAINGSIFDVVDKPRKVDVVLALNIFHHFIKTEALFEMLKQLLSRLTMSEMYFQTHSPDEPQMHGSFLNFEAEEFVQFVIDNSNLSRAEKLVDYPSGRKLFRLSA